MSLISDQSKIEIMRLALRARDQDHRLDVKIKNDYQDHYKSMIDLIENHEPESTND